MSPRAAMLRWILPAALALGCGGGQAGRASGNIGAGSTGSGSTDAGTLTSTGTTGTSTSTGGSSSGSSASSAGGTTGADVGTMGCPPVPACDGPLPDPGPAQPWRHTSSSLIVLSGSPNHRVRDMFYLPGDTQWLIGKFSYGITDKDLKDEDVDVYLQRGCAGPWEYLGTQATTQDGQMMTVEGVEDSGGRVYVALAPDAALSVGRHRVHMVVRGDLSAASGIIEVVAPKTPIFLTDIDGTLTTQENEEFTALLTGQTPDANPSAAEALWLLAERGYRPFYLTARPEYLVERTREFIEVRGFPPGVIHTTTSLTGATGSAAVTYKTDELAALAGRDLVPAYAIGNTASDAEAYDNGGIQPLSARIFFQYTDTFGGRRIEDYGELLGEFGALPPVCP